MFHHDARDKAVAEATAKSDFERRLAARFEAGRAANAAVIKQIEEEGNALIDLIVPVGERGMRFVPSEKRGLRLVCGANGDQREFDVHPHAAGQAADRAGVPRAFMTRLLAAGDWGRRLLANNLNECLAHQSSRDRMLVRAVGTDVRGLLSPAYKRLDSRLILGRFLSESMSCGAQVASAVLDDTRFYVEAYLPHVFPVETPRNGVEYISIGVVYSTSDFGDGADECRCVVERAWCTNRAITASNIRTVHLGRRMEGFNIAWSRETYTRDTVAQASAVADVVRASLDANRVRALLSGVQMAAADEVDIDAGVKQLARAGCSDSEVEEATKLLAAGDESVVAAGPLTSWKLGQAVAAVARGTQNVRRRYELEQLAGRVMGLK